MALGKSKLKRKNLKPEKLRDVSSPGQITDMLVNVRQLQNQLEALLQKMDSDTGIADTDYEATIEAVK